MLQPSAKEILEAVRAIFLQVSLFLPSFAFLPWLIYGNTVCLMELLHSYPLNSHRFQPTYTIVNSLLRSSPSLLTLFHEYILFTTHFTKSVHPFYNHHPL